MYSRIIDFQQSMPIITKTGENPFFKSKYAPLDSIQKAIQKPLAEAGLGYTQEATNEGLKTTLFDIDGNTKEFMYPAVFQGKPQDIGSAMTYAKRYALTACLGLIIEGEDDDGNTAQNSSNQNFEAKPKIEVWMSQEQFDKAMASQDSNVLNTILNSKTTKEGKTFGMKKEFREKLTEKLNNL